MTETKHPSENTDTLLGIRLNQPVKYQGKGGWTVCGIDHTKTDTPFAIVRNGYWENKKPAISHWVKREEIK